MNNKNNIDLLYSNGIIYLGNFRDLANKLKKNYLDHHNDNCDYIDSKKEIFKNIVNYHWIIMILPNF